ncbi:MAG: D-alanine--D-alanine ligase, partial [Bacillota bacterium]
MSTKVALIYGGKSQEREISLRTGKQVSSALLEKGFEVITLDLDEDIATTLLRAKPDVVFIALHGKYG